MLGRRLYRQVFDPVHRRYWYLVFIPMLALLYLTCTRAARAARAGVCSFYNAGCFPFCIVQ